MIAELLAGGHRGRIVSVVSVRHLADAAYRRQHTALAERHPNYRYVVVTTREPAASASGAVRYFGQCHLQDLVATGELERRCDVPLDPARSHVFLCGSPAMIGAQHGATDGQALAPGSMLDLLTRRGFRDSAGAPSPNVHYERYW
jgi:ferredoxin--NADP+ reductase